MPLQTGSTTDFTPYRDRPVEFARDVLGFDLWERQQQILRALVTQDRVTVRSCNGAGKTICAAAGALWFLYTRPGSIVVTTAPTQKQVVNLLWRRLRTLYNGAKAVLPGRCLTAMLDIGTDWYAIGMATDEEVNFQGPHSAAGVLMIADEASGVAEWMYHAMMGSMTEEGAKMLLIGNPNVASGYFYESHRTWPPEQRFHISAHDVPPHVLTPTWAQGMLKDLGEESPVYQVRVLGNFPEQGDDALISLKWVEEAGERDTDRAGPTEIGVDVARFGADESVAYVRCGSRIVDADHWRGQDLVTAAGRVAFLANQHRASAIKVDTVGVGAGLADRLRETFPAGSEIEVIDINVGERPLDTEHYQLYRDEIFFGLRQRFKEGEISIPKEDSLLMDQLTSLKYGFTPTGKLKVESKDDLRKRRAGNHTWQSPDRADALALAFAAPKVRELEWRVY